MMSMFSGSESSGHLEFVLAQKFVLQHISMCLRFCPPFYFVTVSGLWPGAPSFIRRM
jgi:hypothetical protein